MLDKYKKQKGDWAVYEKEFLALLSERKVAEKIDPDRPVMQRTDRRALSPPPGGGISFPTLG